MNTLARTIWPVADSQRLVRNVILAFIGTVAIAISAKIQIPFYPVPMTMQTFVILVIGMAYGWRLGGATVLMYLAEGAVGIPVFAGTPAKGIGMAYMVGSTGGDLVGFLLAAMAVGWLAEKGWDRNVLKTLAAMTVGTAIIFVPGLLWLGILFGWEKPILAWGLTPFLLAAAFKISLAAAVLPLAWKAVGRRGV